MNRSLYSYFYSIYYLIIMLVFAFYESAEMESVVFTKLNLVTDNSVLRYRLFLIVLCGGFSLFHQWPKNQFSKVFITMMAFIWGISMWNLDYVANINFVFIQSVTILLPIFVFQNFYVFAQKVNTNTFLLGLGLACLPIFITLLRTYQIQILFSLTDTTKIASLYIFLFLLPLLLTIKKTYIRIGAIVFVAGCMVFSMKRGGFVAFILALLTYYIVNLYINKGVFKWRTLLLMILVVTLIYMLVTYALSNYADEMMQRLSEMSEDEGSGRYQVYETTWNMINHSDTMSLWLGHGWNTVVKNSPMKLSAHNDFLEVIYDFGIIAFCIYVYFHYRVCKSMFELIRCRSYYAPALAFSVVTFIINSMVAHILIYPYNLIIFALVWGYIIGKERARISQNNQIKI